MLLFYSYTAGTGRVLVIDPVTWARTQAAHPLTQALEQYSSSEPAVHSGLFLNALISCAP